MGGGTPAEIDLLTLLQSDPLTMGGGTPAEIVFFKVKTTNPFQGWCAILEFGAIVVCPKKLVELQNYLMVVKPANLNLITPTMVECNGIKREDLASTFAEFADDVYNILHGKIWAGHNILDYDCPRIFDAFAEIGRDPPEPKGIIDSLVLVTQRLGIRDSNMKLATLAAHFGLGNQTTHRTLDDIRMNLEVLKCCATALFLGSSLPDELIEYSEHADQKTGENSTSKAILSRNPFDMSTLRKEISGEVIQSTQTVASDDAEGTSYHERFLDPNEISIPSIRAICSESAGSPKQKIQLFDGDRPICLLHCPHLKVQFGIKSKFLDAAGNPKLNFVVYLNPTLYDVLQGCDRAAHTSIASGSSSKWHAVIIQKELSSRPTARIHIQTKFYGDGYATEIHLKEFSATQKLISRNPNVQELKDMVPPGTVLDAFLSLEPYDFEHGAGIRLVARKLVILRE